MKKYKYIFLIGAALIGFTSCEDLLNKTPQSQLTPEAYYRNDSDFQLATNPFYNNIIEKEPYEAQSDQCVKLTPTNRIRGGNSMSVPASGGGWDWYNVRAVNTILSFLEKCEDPVVVKKYSALCKFFRAMEYYTKVCDFGDVPWIDHELGSTDPLLYAPRDSREVVTAHMVEDIDEAIEGLPETYPDQHHYRATKWAALTLKSRFCLFEGTFRKYHGLNLEGHDYKFYLEQAAAAAEKVIDESPHKLYTTGHPEKDYLNLFANYDETKGPGEYILTIDYDLGRNMCHNATAVTLMVSQGGLSLTRKFVNAYLMADGSRFTDKPGWETMQFKEETAGRDPRLAQTIRTPGYKRINSSKVEGPSFTSSVTGYQLVKFVMPADNPVNDKFGQSYNDMPIMRLAEVYLNFAEAKAELGTLTQADLDKSVNLLRQRVGMPKLVLAEANANPDWYLASKEYGYPNVSGPNKGIILEIRRERAVELVEEGFRFNDLLRWKSGKSLEQAVSGMYFPGPGQYDLDGDGKADVVLYLKGTPKPSVANAEILLIGEELLLSEEDKGYVAPYKKISISFDEGRDYYLPIPIDDRTLNNNLAQNPGWADGLDF